MTVIVRHSPSRRIRLYVFASPPRVRVDTAGAGELSHRVAIPYLDRDVASGLSERLAASAANAAFRW